MVHYSNPGTQVLAQKKDFGTVTRRLVPSVLWCKQGLYIVWYFFFCNLSFVQSFVSLRAIEEMALNFMDVSIKGLTIFHIFCTLFLTSH